MSKKFLLYFFLFILILFFVFRDLILNISTNLLDWRDYPFIIWVIYQNITHITSLNFLNFFETNAFYPHKLTLMFSDILLPQALILLPLFYLIKNIILSFNITFLITFLLNFIATFLFWKQIFKKETIAFFGSIFFIFSPFFHLELSHFQMLTFWPYFLTLYFLLKNEGKPETKNFIFVGLIVTIQFLASVYLSVYLIFSILLFYFLKIVLQKDLKKEVFGISLIFLVFLISSGIFIKGYIDMKNTYNIKRDLKEYVTYSANISDYLFTSQINSLIHRSSLMENWNKADKNWSLHSSFPGFLIFLLSIPALFKLRKNRDIISINLELNREKLFFTTLIVVGFLFSLGPRLNFNGNYAHIPLPYSLVIKFIPVSEVIRVPSRWSFLFFLGFIYFSLITLNKLTGKPYYKFFLFLVFVIFILEYLPINIKSTQNSYINRDYQILKNLCKNNKKVLLELPATHLDAYPNIIEGLEYISKVELVSTYHNCNIVNGYSGYDLPDIFLLSDTLSKYIKENNTRAFTEEVQKRKIDIVKFNQYYFVTEMKLSIHNFVNAIATESGVEKINNDLFSFHR